MCVLLAMTALFAEPMNADIRLPGIISERMILQRDMPVRLWGWADDGEVVKATLAENTATATAVSGKWDLTLPPMKAGGPHTLTFQGKNTITFKDVLVGEVWVSCGQSNMMMGLSAVEGGPDALKESSKHPNIRVVQIPCGSHPRPQDDVKCAWGAMSGGFSAVSYFFGLALNENMDVPVGLINAVAIAPGEAWIDEATLLSVPALREMPNRPIKPVLTFNAMIAPLTKFPIRGAIYYQGEYNASAYGGGPQEYRKILPTVIASWRKAWGRDDMPFLFVQLSSFTGEQRGETSKALDMPQSVLAAQQQPGAGSAWAALREAQLLTWMSTPNTGMAVTVDVGDPYDIHPKRKKPVGERLALIARAVAYKQPVVYSGPVFSGVKTDGGTLALSFKFVGGGLVAQGGELKGFEISGADQKYVWAKAEIAGDTVRLSNPKVEEPVYARYGWANFPVCNLFNKEGLPASPFRVFINGKACQRDSITISYRNPSFEAADKEPSIPADWALRGKAARTDEKASEGRWSVKLLNEGDNKDKGSIGQAKIVPENIYFYDWNSDLLEPVAFRPGMVAGYSVDIASDGVGECVAYLRLCSSPDGGGIGYWSDKVPVASTSSGSFVSRRVAGVMTQKFPNSTKFSVGILAANNPEVKSSSKFLYLDNFSAIQVIRPKLAVSDTSVIDLGKVPINTEKTSPPRSIINCQAETLPDQRADKEPERRLSTILYGVLNVKTSTQGYERVVGATDDVGAVIIGKDVAFFEFVTEHSGASAKELRLLGADGKSGLVGGASPESEPLAIRFKGSPIPGKFEATIRIVTQAGNCGLVSTGKAGEPIENIFYLDIPAAIHVTR